MAHGSGFAGPVDGVGTSGTSALSTSRFAPSTRLCTAATVGATCCRKNLSKLQLSLVGSPGMVLPSGPTVRWHALHRDHRFFEWGMAFVTTISLIVGRHAAPRGT
uniref:Uncharacterized protein n=1 Tax=Strigamia maritima TaxID=126957 RepID=T1JF03_STRMM